MICRRFTEISEDSNYCIMMKKRKMKSFSIIISLFTLLHLLLTFYIPSRKAVPILRRIRKLPNGTVLYEKGMDIYKIGVKETFYLFKGFSKRNLQRNTNVQKVDLVYTWVNGRDPKWLNKFYNAVREEHIHIPRKHISTRFLDYEELKYSLRSVDLYLPWINKIYIVTASQIP
ncbi:hypothetical protein TRFO_40938 [Tritrichomonas foetus]|uniref:Uncharacterized protein n=1 Tax=Tritrichomonas foetus TaxID=1144522 RepID=A0A1J4J1S1_9EUKA|nr:hypothetical protein TRFO_40938 [Tritrichomonas foetus]|eukprot:OHS92721.1 hypothetical protein TRFO_40938 [Tritrichomonas foetus]